MAPKLIDVYVHKWNKQETGMVVFITYLRHVRKRKIVEKRLAELREERARPTAIVPVLRDIPEPPGSNPGLGKAEPTMGQETPPLPNGAKREDADSIKDDDGEDDEEDDWDESEEKEEDEW